MSAGAGEDERMPDPGADTKPAVPRGEGVEPTVEPAAPAPAPVKPAARAVPPAAAAEPAPTVEPAAPAPATPTPKAGIEPPSPDVTIVSETSLPGVHRGGFARLPTGPVNVTTQSAPAEPGNDTNPTPLVQWLMPEQAPPYTGLAGWALAFSIMGLAVSFFVGWGFPIGLVGAITAIVALRRPLESRGVAVWALVIGLLSVLYSVGWLLYAAQLANVWGTVGLSG